MDEAETRLKSALAVKVFGANLETLGDRRENPSSRYSSGYAESAMSPWFRSSASRVCPSRSIAPRSRALWPECRRHQRLGPDGHRRGRRHPGRYRRKSSSISSSVSSREYRDNPEEIGNILVATAAGQQIPLKETADIPRDQGCLVHLPPEQLALHRRSIFGGGAGSGGRGERRHSAGTTKGWAFLRVIIWIGAANLGIHLIARTIRLILPLTFS